MLDMYVSIDTTYAALMQLAAREINTATNDNNSQPTKCQVSFDGTWQKRGFSSSNGIVTATNSTFTCYVK